MSVKAILTDQQRSYTKAEEDALLAQKQDTLIFDNEPTQNSDNPVKSSGIKAVIDNVINGVTPVALAENLTSDSAQSSADTFIERTTGGTASLSDGDGWIQVVRGSHTHTGYVPSDVDITVTPVLHTLTGIIDQETFFAAVGDDSGTKTFIYTTNWDYNPVTYGITLTGTPLAGDQIVVTYDTNSAVSMTVNSLEEDITATIDEEDFLAQVSGSSGTITFTYTDSWDTNPATYGITVTGTPTETDSISVTYLITHIASMTVLPIYHSISAEIDEDTFLSEMSNASGYMEFTYTTNWDYNPVTYGITVTGSPISGDKIRVDYIKETRGTITQSNPQSFKSSGWNLYNHTNGYARVLKYSEVYGFGIAGTYTSLTFSPTISGAQTSVTVTDGKFTINEDGYIFVTGGNDTDTQIWMTWSDWISQANGGTWEAYTESTVDFSSIMSSYFPYGLLEVGSYQDEINFSAGVAINKVARMAYSSANLATVRAMGVDYEYDENYIYYALSAPVSNSISIDNSFDAYDHGLEWFTETALAVYAQTIYGINLKNKLERDVLTISQQSLTSNDIAQVRENLKMSYQFNPNLLRNWYFVGGGTGRGVFPVNQRGQSSYGTGVQYNADGWIGSFGNGGVNVILAQTGISVGPVNTSNHGLLMQAIDSGTFDAIIGKQVTGSLLLSNGDFFYGTVTVSSSTVRIVSVTYNEKSLYLDLNGSTKRFLIDRWGSPIEIAAVKLELGTDQTLAHQENGVWVLNEVPDYEEELYKCMTSTADSTDIYANKSLYPNVPNKNLLDNWYFVNPINQRGSTTYTDSDYCIDRWQNTWGDSGTGSTVTLTSSGCTLTPASSSVGTAVMLQSHKKAFSSGDIITISALISDGTLLYHTFAISSAPSYECSFTYDSYTFKLMIINNQRQTRIVRYGTGITIAAVKLEYGTQQTLAHQENGTWVLNEIPNYEEELFQCSTSTADSSDTYANKPNANATVRYYPSQAVGAGTNFTMMRIPAGSATDPNITTDTVVLECTFAAPSSITSDITWTSYAGYINFVGSCSAATTANVTLGRKGN